MNRPANSLLLLLRSSHKCVCVWMEFLSIGF
jgi:hypothetical protein